MKEEIEDFELESFPDILEKDSRAKRWMKSAVARLRRKETKQAREAHSFKEDKDAKERLKAKRLLERQKKEQKVKKSS